LVKLHLLTHFRTDNIGLGSIDIRIPVNFQDEFFSKFLNKHNVQYKVIIEDVQKLLDQEISEMSKRMKYDPKNKNSENQFFTNFRTIEEINSWISNKAQTSNGLAKVVTLGHSYEKRPQIGLVITGLNNNPNKPDIMYNSLPRMGICYHGDVDCK
jgi:ribosomal protein S16